MSFRRYAVGILGGGAPRFSKVKLPFLVVSVGQACTLKCRDCANFSPYAKKGSLLYPCQDILSDLKRILDVCIYIDVVQVQGGEPFMYPELDKVLQLLISEKKVRNIHVATNGTVVPERLLDLLKDKKVMVRISNYKVVDISKIDKLCRVFDKNGITYEKYGFTKNDDKWIACGGPEMPKEQEDKIVADRFEKCLFNSCLTLENGYIGKCSRSIHAAIVQGFKPKQEDYIAVRECKNLRKELHKYNDKCIPKNKFFMEACRFCYGTFYGEEVEPAIQIK